jgi:hypothetical protein
MAASRNKTKLLRTEDHIAAIQEPRRLPALDTPRKTAKHIKLADDLLVRRCHEKASAALALLPSGRLIGLHQTADGMMMLHIRAMYPAALTDCDRQLLNDYLFSDGANVNHYTDELLNH